MLQIIDVFIKLGLQFPNWIIGVVPDDDVGLGISWLFQLSDAHPLHLAAVIHDMEYQVKKESSSLNADLRFKWNALRLAQGRYKLIAETYFFYSLCRIWGLKNWKNKHSKSLFRKNSGLNLLPKG